jgi:hypothetical protein
MKMGHWWNDTDRRKQNYVETAPSQCHFVHHKSHIVSQGLRWDRPARATGRPIPFLRVFMSYALTTAHPTMVYGTVLNRLLDFLLFYLNQTPFNFRLV